MELKEKAELKHVNTFLQSISGLTFRSTWMECKDWQNCQGKDSGIKAATIIEAVENLCYLGPEVA